MKLTENTYLVGGGPSLGFGLSQDPDCHVYVVSAGNELVLIDAGTGPNIEPILENIKQDGLDPENISTLFLTHAHADHAGAAHAWRERFGVRVVCSKETAAFLRAGDEKGISLDAAKEAGYYAPNYRFIPCAVAQELAEPETMVIGGIEMQVIETPGHASGLLSFLCKSGKRRDLFSGDAVFHGGKIHLINAWDTDVFAYSKSLAKLAGLTFDGLFPGHLAIALTGGQRHVARAHEIFSRLSVPPAII